VLANHDAYNLPGAELALARAQLSLGQLDSALMLAQHGFAFSQQARDNMGLSNASDILAQTYARRGDFAQAYHYQSLWVSYQDSLAGAETQRKTSALRYGYELDKKQDQITLLTQARQLQRQQLWGCWCATSTSSSAPTGCWARKTPTLPTSATTSTVL